MSSNLITKSPLTFKLMCFCHILIFNKNLHYDYFCQTEFTIRSSLGLCFNKVVFVVSNRLRSLTATSRHLCVWLSSLIRQNRVAFVCTNRKLYNQRIKIIQNLYQNWSFPKQIMIDICWDIFSTIKLTIWAIYQ